MVPNQVSYAQINNQLRGPSKNYAIILYLFLFLFLFLFLTLSRSYFLRIGLHVSYVADWVTESTDAVHGPAKGLFFCHKRVPPVAPATVTCPTVVTEEGNDSLHPTSKYNYLSLSSASISESVQMHKLP